MILNNGVLSDFINATKGKDIICFGAGKWLNWFLNIYKQHEQIKMIVDNDPSKWGGAYITESAMIPIASIETALNEYPDFVLMISIGVQGLHVIKQLNQIPCMSEKNVWWSYFLVNNSKEKVAHKMNGHFHISKHQNIPKIIHYCWFGKNNMPSEFQKYIDGWKRLCPDYEIKCWNENNYDVTKNAYMKKAYEERMWGFVPDYARKDIIYEYGGIYLDTDVELIKKPDGLLYQDGFCGWEEGFVNFGLGFGARPRLPIIKELRDLYEDIEFVKQKKMKTGPEYETELLEKHGLKLDGSYQIVEGLTVYPMEVLSGTNVYNGVPYITKNTVSVHHYAGTWIDEEAISLRKKIQALYTLLVNNNNCLDFNAGVKI